MNPADFFKYKTTAFNNSVMVLTGVIVGPLYCLRYAISSQHFPDLFGWLACAVIGIFAVPIVVLCSLVISWAVLSKIEYTDEQDTAKLILASCTTLIAISIIVLLIHSGGSMFQSDHSLEMGGP